MSRRRITVTIHDAVSAEVSGYGSRDLVTELRGRPPVFNTRSRAWVVQTSTARDVIAVAESRGYDVLILGEAS